MSMNIGSKLVSKLGSPNSRIPLAAKDIFNSAGYTYFSYDAGGKIEGKDRLVDEVGTGALWLFGIPAYKKLIDKTIFKKAGISPEVDVRILKDNDYLKKAIENAPTKTIMEDLKKAGANISKTKALTILKFGMSLGLTMLSYFALTKFKQNMTKKNIEKEFLAKQIENQPETLSPYNNENPIFSDFNQGKKKNNTPSFGSSSLSKVAESIVLNPINNMFVLDTCISGERLSSARTKGEFAEYGIKEGSFLFFVYIADKLIKKGIETASEKILKSPIKLDAKFLSTNLAENILKQKSLQDEIKEFSKKFGKNCDTNALYEYIFKNQNSTVVEAAKSSGIISTIKTGQIDTRKYIDVKKMQELAENLQKFISSSTNSNNTKSYLNKIKALKVGSTMLNIGVCCLFLGYVVPKMMYDYRKKHQNGKNDFHVKTEYEKELATKHAKSL